MYDDEFSEKFKDDFVEKMKSPGMDDVDFDAFKNTDYTAINKSAIDYSDAIIIGSKDVKPELIEYAKKSGKPILEYVDSEEYYTAYNEFYDKIIG